MPDIPNLNRLCRSLAMLDAIMSIEWQFRYYSFNSKWAPGLEMASIRNGSGDDLFLLFDKNGAIMKGFDHESNMSPYQFTPQKIWPGIYDTVPASFKDFLEEPAFTAPDCTFCVWREMKDTAWHCGEIEYPAGDRDPDGSERILALFNNNPQSYCDWAGEYYEKEIPLDAVVKIYGHEPLSIKLVHALNADLALKDLEKDIAEIGFPTKN